MNPTKQLPEADARLHVFRVARVEIIDDRRSVEENKHKESQTAGRPKKQTRISCPGFLHLSCYRYLHTRQVHLRTFLSRLASRMIPNFWKLTSRGTEKSCTPASDTWENLRLSPPSSQHDRRFGWKGRHCRHRRRSHPEHRFDAGDTGYSRKQQKIGNHDRDKRKLNRLLITDGRNWELARAIPTNPRHADRYLHPRIAAITLLLWNGKCAREAKICDNQKLLARTKQLM